MSTPPTDDWDTKMKQVDAAIKAANDMHKDYDADHAAIQTGGWDCVKAAHGSTPQMTVFAQFQAMMIYIFARLSDNQDDKSSYTGKQQVVTAKLTDTIDFLKTQTTKTDVKNDSPNLALQAQHETALIDKLDSPDLKSALEDLGNGGNAQSLDLNSLTNTVKELRGYIYDPSDAKYNPKHQDYGEGSSYFWDTTGTTPFDPKDKDSNKDTYMIGYNDSATCMGVPGNPRRASTGMQDMNNDFSSFTTTTQSMSSLTKETSNLVNSATQSITAFFKALMQGQSQLSGETTKNFKTG